MFRSVFPELFDRFAEPADVFRRSGGSDRTGGAQDVSAAGRRSFDPLFRCPSDIVGRAHENRVHGIEITLDEVTSRQLPLGVLQFDGPERWWIEGVNTVCTRRSHQV